MVEIKDIIETDKILEKIKKKYEKIIQKELSENKGKMSWRKATEISIQKWTEIIRKTQEYKTVTTNKMISASSCGLCNKDQAFYNYCKDCPLARIKDCCIEHGSTYEAINAETDGKEFIRLCKILIMHMKRGVKIPIKRGKRIWEE